MSNLKILQNSTRRNILKVIGISLIGSSGFALYNSYKRNLKKSIWTGNVLNAPAKIEIHSTNKKLNNNVIKKIEDLPEVHCRTDLSQARQSQKT